MATKKKAPTPYVYPVKVLKIIDGDTLDISIDLGFKIYKHDRVRLNTIDTSEIFGSNKTPEGKKSKAFTTAWVKQAKLIYLHSTKYDDREKYGRILGDFHRVLADDVPDTISLGAALRKEGHAKKVPKKPKQRVLPRGS